MLKIRYLQVGLLALLLCSCTDQTEVAKLQAELTAAREETAKTRAELEALKAEINKNKTEVEHAKTQAQKLETDAKAAKEKRAKAEVEVMNRWNAVAAGMNFNVPNFGNINFRWAEVGNFPHPTFKGGSAEAYGAFAQVLAAFLQQGDNLKYLAENGMLTAELRTTVPGGSGKGTGWSFANFVAQFTAPGAYGNLDEGTRKTLTELSEQIRAILGKQENQKS